MKCTRAPGIHFYDTMFKEQGFGLVFEKYAFGNKIMVSAFDNFWSDNNNGDFITCVTYASTSLVMFERPVNARDISFTSYASFSTTKACIVRPTHNHWEYITVLMYLFRQMWKRDACLSARVAVLLPYITKNEIMGHVSTSSIQEIIDLSAIKLLSLQRQLDWFNMMLPGRKA
jgi:hypothetical protein